MLDKKQAAEYLQVTTRSLERYTNEGRINVRYEQSLNGEIAMFDPEELKKFKTDKQISRIKLTPHRIRREISRIGSQLRFQIGIVITGDYWVITGDYYLTG